MIPHMRESNLPSFTLNPFRDTSDKLHYEHKYII